MADYNLAQTGNLSPEDFAQQQQLNRQQQMAQMLMQQSAQPQGQMISGRYVAPSWAQSLVPLANIAASKYLGEKADTKAADLAKAIRAQEVADIGKYNQILKGTEAVPAKPEKYTELAGPYDKENKMPLAYMEAKPAQAAIPGNAEAANLFAASSYSPILRQMGIKRMTEGPKWEKAVMPQPDGSERHGWVNYASANPKDTFIEGGTKPAYTPMEAAKFTYETGMAPPSGAPKSYVQNPPAVGVPAQPGAPVQSMPSQGGQPVAPMGNKVAPSVAAPAAAPMSAVNQPIMATGNAVPVSAMNRPGMSPKDLSDANKAVFVESEKGRQADLKKLPGALEQANTAIKTIDQMIGDARLNDKGEIVYQKYDPVTKKYVEGAKPHGGFENYVGATMFPGLRFIEGTDTASFDPLYNSLKGQAFLDAFERIKGGGQITEIEGQKATDALLKLNKAQTEKDFIKYAREFQENLQRGMELAKNKAGVSKNYRSPVNQPKYQWNPQTNSWVTE